MVQATKHGIKRSILTRSSLQNVISKMSTQALA